MQREKFDAATDFIAFTPEQGQASLKWFRDVGRFIHTSTVTTYGEDFRWLPVTEDHPTRSGHAYGRNKTAIDRMHQAAYPTDLRLA